MVKSQKKPLKSITPPSARDSPVSKPVKADPPQILQPFKRPEAIKVDLLAVSELDMDWIHPWIGLDWVRIFRALYGLNWIGVG